MTDEGCVQQKSGEGLAWHLRPPFQWVDTSTSAKRDNVQSRQKLHHIAIPDLRASQKQGQVNHAASTTAYDDHPAKGIWVSPSSFDLPRRDHYLMTTQLRRRHGRLDLHPTDVARHPSRRLPQERRHPIPPILCRQPGHVRCLARAKETNVPLQLRTARSRQLS